MASKDYVNQKPRKRKPKVNAKQQRKVSLIRIVSTFIILISFIAVLFWLSQQPVSEQETEQEAQEQTQSESSQSEGQSEETPPEVKVTINNDPLPELPKEEWEFIKTLPGYEVEVDVEAITSDKLFLMQCGSFRQYAQADEMKATMALAGLEPQIRGSQNGWYRVVLGPYESRRDAQKDRHKLERVRVHGCEIWLWNL